ncbi:MAG: NADH-quinone oxidoreductase subunit N [Actinobacteria bacterium]|nr:NADH-quinone oxidoreductase subunit N [Actinomycetota bacterium]MBW3649495.1 NADH-quinone oxidoreductase subunit N [Actinomycetota bacterium]
MPVGTVVPEIVLVVGAVVVLLFALFGPRRAQAFAAVLALATLLVAAVASAVMLRGPQPITFFDTYAADDAAVWAKLIVLAVAAVVVLLSVEWFATDARHGEYYTLLLLSTLGAVVLASAADLMALILGVLLSSATGYVLAAYHRSDARSGEAGIKYYLLGALTNGAMVYGAVLLFGLGATTTLAGLADALPGAHHLALVAAVALFVVGLAFKLGAVPAHAWVPDVADGAPAPAAAFLTVAPKVGALVALGRLALALPEDRVGWRLLVAVMAAATMTLGNLAALWQDDVRRLLGWSAVSQSGYGLMAVVALGRSDMALASLLYFLAAYAVANLAAFAVVVELRGRSERGRYAGLASGQPLLALVLVLSFLSLVGVPPLAGFTAKVLLFAATVDAGYAWLAVLAVVNSVLSLAYYVRVLAPSYFEPMGAPIPLLGRWAKTAAVGCGAGVVVLGIVAEWPLQAFHLARLLPG